MIKAIETTYAGVRFRSRLEARWAVFFDTLGIKWQYEPQGFEVGLEDEEGRRRWYLPDFLLPDLNLWCEVKGDPRQFDFDLLDDCIDFGMGLPHVECKCCSPRKDVGGLLLLSPIPRPDKEWEPIFPLLYHHKGSLIGEFTFSGRTDCYDNSFALIRGADTRDLGRWFIERGAQLYSHPHFPETIKINRALVAARSARFEHGDREQW